MSLMAMTRTGLPGVVRVSSRVVFGAEGGVEGGGWWVEGVAADEGERVRGAGQAVHAGVLPLDGDRPVVVDRVEHPERGLPGHVAVSDGDEVPAAPGVGPRQVGAQP